MNTNGFVEEDDLILYAMQALSPAEMEQVASQVQNEPQLLQRLTEIQQVLGIYASATTEQYEVPSAALGRLTQAITPKGESKPSRTPVRVEKPKSARGWQIGLLWGGWAVAAMLIIGLAFEYRQNRHVQQNIAAEEANLQATQSQAAALASERDRLQSQLREQNVQIQATREEASSAKNHSAALDAKLAGSDQRAARETARADEMAAAARDAAVERNQLSTALSKEQQQESAASESKQILAALADPTALHVALTVPKQKKRPSGRGTYLASNGTLVFTGSDLSALPTGKVYELWLMPADGSAPIPAGTFTPDSSGNAALTSSHFQKGAAKGFAITVENTGGSTKPTLPILLAGSA